MEREEWSTFVHLGQRVESKTYVSLLVGGGMSLWSLLELMSGSTHPKPILFGAFGGWVAWVAARQVLTRERLEFSLDHVRLVYLGLYVQDSRVFELSEVSALEVEHRYYEGRRQRPGTWTHYFQFRYRGETHGARRQLTKHEAELVQRAIDQLEKRDKRQRRKAGLPREEPLVFRGGLQPHDLWRVRR